MVPTASTREVLGKLAGNCAMFRYKYLKVIFKLYYHVLHQTVKSYECFRLPVIKNKCLTLIKTVRKKNVSALLEHYKMLIPKCCFPDVHKLAS